MIKKNETFYAKILLFGEYSIMCDSMALTVPYTHFKGELSFINDDKYTNLDFATESNKSLREYLIYLQSLNEKKELLFEMDFNAFENDVEAGLYFESTIPQGYGIGSSGALCAAVYGKYSSNKIFSDENISTEDLLRLKRIFAQMESFFHGVSSGMDPLNCYIKNPLLIKSKTNIETVGIPREFSNNGGIFLINTGKPGKTGPLVNLFFEQCKEDRFFNLIKNEMIPFTNGCIQSIVKGDIKAFFGHLKSLSGFLLSNLKPMIPNAFLDAWQRGLESGDYYLKLCGSGGGGFLLGFTEDLDKAQKMLHLQNIEIVPVSKFH
jgi:mevalonate kinase